jgi:hypothetical protein
MKVQMRVLWKRTWMWEEKAASSAKKGPTQGEPEASDVGTDMDVDEEKPTGPARKNEVVQTQRVLLP